MRQSMIKSLLLFFTVILILGLGTISCTPQAPQAPTQRAVSRYTADQVICVAAASPYNSCGYVKNRSAWVAECVSIDSGVWVVTKTCFSQYGGFLYTERYYFFEDNGKLIKSLWGEGNG